MESSVPEIDVQEASRRLESGEPMIDVREEREHGEVRIAGARLLPMSQFLGRWQELPSDQELMIQCRSGARSAQVTRFLLDRGYQAVNVGGGLVAWEDAGLPVERDD